MNKIPIIAVVGATASGKTGLSIELAKRHNAEIISCDSMQIYRGMDIGTAKPDEEEMAGIAHHMIDIVNPDESFSVADFVPMAHKAAEEIVKRGKLPIAVGGTGLYADSFLKDVDFEKNDTSEELRARLQEELEKFGAEHMAERLKSIDPVSAQRIHPNNHRRIIRAIEFYEMTGKPISKHQEETKKKQSRYALLWFMIEHDMESLYERIEKRVDIMIEKGLIKEVEGLCQKGYTKDMTSMQGIGYKEIIDYLNGECTRDEAIEKIKIGTRHYAKRQMTWFRRNPDINRLRAESDYLSECEKIMKQNGF